MTEVHRGAVAVVRAIPVRSAEASRPVQVANRCRTSPNAPTNEGSRRNIASVTVATRRSAASDAVRSICRGAAGKPITEPPSLNLTEVPLVRSFRGEVTMIADPGAGQGPEHTSARGETVYKDAGRLSWRNRGDR